MSLGGYGWLLLCHTVDRTQAPDQGLTGDAKHTALWKHILQNCQRFLIIVMAVDWHQDNTIGDIKVRIAGGQARGYRSDLAGHGQRNNA